MKLITSNFRTHIAEQFFESFSEAANTIYYVTAHRSNPFPNDSSPPTPVDSVSETSYELFDDVIFGKAVTAADVNMMVDNNGWLAGTVYDAYDPLDPDLATKKFYVRSAEGGSHHVFKCLNNNRGAPSTDRPLLSMTSPEDEIYKTSDGYQWKFMYTISSSKYNAYATNDFIPVVTNNAVKTASMPGSIDSIIITDIGENYNSFTTGTIRQAAVAGNAQLHSISGDVYTDFYVTVANTDGIVEERVTSTNTNGKTGQGVVVGIYPANNTVRITSVINTFNAGRTLVGALSNTSSSIVSSERIRTEISSNTDFYKNCSFYIRDGLGAGQLRTITEYIVTGNERRVLLNAPFDTLPDTSSVFEIAPRVVITGDGHSANAIVTVNPSTNSIFAIDMISAGRNYTFADVVIVGNTGLIDISSNQTITSTSAQARAIISPPTGHGYNAPQELYSRRVGIGVQYNTSESGTIPTTGRFRRIALLREPRFERVVLTLDTSTASNFTAGEAVTQPNGASGNVFDRDGATLTLTNVRGSFAVGANVAGSTATALVDAVTPGIATFDQRQIFQVTVQPGPTGLMLQPNEQVVQTGLLTTDSGTVVKLSIDRPAIQYAPGEIITQANTGATGVVSLRVNSTLTLTNIAGTFLSGNTTQYAISGSGTGLVSAVDEVDNTYQANATGTVFAANSSVVSLTNVKGTFALSDLPSGTINTLTGQKSGAIATLTGRDDSNNRLMSDVGEFLYVENMEPVLRSGAQSERFKLIVEF